jgi:hypothetical protein
MLPWSAPLAGRVDEQDFASDVLRDNSVTLENTIRWLTWVMQRGGAP